MKNHNALWAMLDFKKCGSTVKVDILQEGISITIGDENAVILLLSTEQTMALKEKVKGLIINDKR